VRLGTQAASSAPHRGLGSHYCLSVDSHLESLAVGPRYRFADWPNTVMPRGPVGVYTVWLGASFLYVGMSWKEHTERGLWGRMNSHASGRRSGDQFCVYICDRFVVPKLSAEEQRLVGADELKLDDLTRGFIADNLDYRFALTESGDQARSLERRVRSEGLLGCGLPFLNPA